jgi:hypothetical protein
MKEYNTLAEIMEDYPAGTPDPGVEVTEELFRRMCELLRADKEDGAA